MPETKTRLSRRDFLKTAFGFGVTAAAAAIGGTPPVEASGAGSPKTRAESESPVTPEVVVTTEFLSLFINKTLADEVGLGRVLGKAHLVYFEPSEVVPGNVNPSKQGAISIGEVIEDRPYEYFPGAQKGVTGGELFVGIKGKGMHVPIGSVADRLYAKQMMIGLSSSSKEVGDLLYCRVARIPAISERGLGSPVWPEEPGELGAAVAWGYRFGIASSGEGIKLIIVTTQYYETTSEVGVYTLPLKGLGGILLHGKNEDTLEESLTVSTLARNAFPYGQFEKMVLMPTVLQRVNPAMLEPKK